MERDEKVLMLLCQHIAGARRNTNTNAHTHRHPLDLEAKKKAPAHIIPAELLWSYKFFFIYARIFLGGKTLLLLFHPFFRSSFGFWSSSFGFKTRKWIGRLERAGIRA
jgi:hypothetical protein